MKKGDVVLISILAALTLAVFFVSRATAPKARSASLYVDGELVCEIAGGGYRFEDGERYIEIEMTEAGARVVSSSCRDGLCVACGAATRAGESIICLPNDAVLTLSGEDALDAEV